MEVAVRLQSVMQAHCNEALRLLSNGTPPPTALTNELTVCSQLSLLSKGYRSKLREVGRCLMEAHILVFVHPSTI